MPMPVYIDWEYGHNLIAKVPGNESSKEQKFQDAVGTFARGSELAQEQKGSVLRQLYSGKVQNSVCILQNIDVEHS